MDRTSRPRFRLGIDIGGTFTDVVLLNEQTGEVRVAKVLTTPKDPSEGFLSGMRRVLAETGIAATDLLQLVHGTTLVTNAVIERKGARTGLITTKGFRDVLEIGRELRYDLYDLYLRMPEPLVPRTLRREVPERMRADGTVHTPLDVAVVDAEIRSLLDSGVEAFAVCMLHSYANDAHERAIAERIRKLAPHAFVSLSSEVVRELKEYERTSTTVMNAYVQPITARYVKKLEGALREEEFKGSFFMMLSNGGIAPAVDASTFPVRLLESGPAAGVLVAAYVARKAGEDDIIAFDMGGTTAKAALVDDGKPLKAHQFEAARVHRFRKGSGFPVKVPVIELIEIGAGGGSIAWVDNLGLLKVGPESAGSDPGPACYGLGGREPTVTDADLVLGYLNPDFFLGGGMKLDRGKALAAIAERLSPKLGQDPLDVARGIVDLVNENMATAFRVHVAERGRDPRYYALVATGGAGPVHAYQVGRRIGVKKVIYPYAAGVASSLGLLVAPATSEHVHSYTADLASVDWQRLERIFNEMEEKARASLLASGVPEDAIRITRSADIRYTGQGYEVSVQLPDGPLSAGRLPAIQAEFERTYRQLYGRILPGVAIQGISWRVVASGPEPYVATPATGGGGEPVEACLKGYREAWVPEWSRMATVPVYDRYLLATGHRIAGPAILEERESTVVVGAAGEIAVDQHKNIIVTLAPQQEAAIEKQEGGHATRV